jgi:hypothetical protein
MLGDAMAWQIARHHTTKLGEGKPEAQMEFIAAFGGRQRETVPVMGRFFAGEKLDSDGE